MWLELEEPLRLLVAWLIGDRNAYLCVRPHSASRSWQMPQAARMKKGRSGSRRDSHTEATMLTPSRSASQKAPISWHKLAPEFGESKQTLVKIWPVSVLSRASEAGREFRKAHAGLQRQRAIDRCVCAVKQDQVVGRVEPSPNLRTNLHTQKTNLNVTTCFYWWAVLGSNQ